MKLLYAFTVTLVVFSAFSLFATIEESNGVSHVAGSTQYASHESQVFDPYAPRSNETLVFWMGNNFIPNPKHPDFHRLFTAREIHEFFVQRSTLWIGDSTGRRNYATMFAIIAYAIMEHIPHSNLDDQNMINKNKGAENVADSTEVCDHVWAHNPTSLCRAVPGADTGRYFDFGGQQMCYKSIPDFAQNITQYGKYDLIILSQGPWETAPWRNQRQWCTGEDEKEGDFPDSMYKRMELAIDALSKIAGPERQIVWRTSGYNSGKINEHITTEMNKRAMDQIDRIRKEKWEKEGVWSNMTYVDWGKAIHSRSYNPSKITADGPNHYGLEARLMFQQLLMGSLIHHQELSLAAKAMQK